MKKKLLAKVHIGKNDLGLSEQKWRNLILEVSKNRTSSSKELKIWELEEVLKKLKGWGFIPKTTVAEKESPDFSKLTHRLKHLLHLLKLPENYAEAMAKNMFQISNLSYLQFWQLEKIVKTLEQRKLKASNERFL